MNKIDFQKIVKSINNLWLIKYARTFFDIEDKQHLYKFVKDINNIPNVTDVILGNRERVKYLDLDKDVDYMYSHSILIKINNIKLAGKINLIEKLGGDYNMVLCLQPIPIQESYILNESLCFKSFFNELKKCNNFNDIKRTVKKYSKEVIIGTLITVVLCNFNLNDAQIYELGTINDSNVVQAEQFYDYSEDEEILNQQIEPVWTLLCDDTEVTVYHAKKSQCNNDIQHTASMFKLNLTNPESHKIIAMERTMMKQYGLRYGDLIKIEGTGERDGVYQLQDTMNKRFKNKHKVDILINDGSQIGKWNNVKIFKLSNPDACYYDFKEDMEDALNQDSIDRRQNHQKKKILREI